MNPYIVALLKVVVLEALAGLVVVSQLCDDGSSRRRRLFDAAFALVALLAICGYFNFGAFRWEGGLVNQWEHFHFFLGSKYLPEIGYDAIYEATAVAIDERYRGSVDGMELRDPMTFQLEPAAAAVARSAEIKQRFSEARWQSFAEDCYFFYGRLRLPVADLLRDHGNTGSPSWAAAAGLLTAPFAPTRSVLNVVSFVDVALLVLLFTVMALSFGLRPMLITLSVTMLQARAYDFLGGSILRLDWLVALGLCACALKAGRPRWAGATLAWAVASKPFCALFALALGARFVWLSWQRRRLDRAHVELVAASVLALVVIVLVSSTVLGGFGVWVQYVDRLQANLSEKYYWDNHGLRDIYLQVVLDGPLTLLDWTPEQVANGLPEIRIEDHALGFGLARAILISLLLVVMARSDDDVIAFALGALWVWVVFVTNMYYWQMIAVPVLAFAASPQRSWRHTAYVAFIPVYGMASYIFVHFNLRHLEGYFGSCWLGTWLLLIAAVELGSWATERRRAATEAAPPAPEQRRRR